MPPLEELQNNGYFVCLHIIFNNIKQLMDKVLNLLREQVKNNPAVTSSVLGLTDTWKSSHYSLLSAIINDILMNKELLQGEKKFEIGNTISASTLKRIFENQFSSAAYNDVRFVKTLDKLSIFLDYSDFNDFIKKSESTWSIPQNKNEEFSLDFFENIIRKSNELEFDFVLGTKKIENSPLDKFVFEDGPFFNRIETYLQKLKNLKLTIINDPIPNYQVYNFSFKTKSEELVVISTEEFWNYTFIDKKNKKHYYHTSNKQDYFFKKDGDTWKIWDNFNPNVWELTDKI